MDRIVNIYSEDNKKCLRAQQILDISNLSRTSKQNQCIVCYEANIEDQKIFILQILIILVIWYLNHFFLFPRRE